MPVTDMAELRVVYPPPKAQTGLKGPGSSRRPLPGLYRTFPVLRYQLRPSGRTGRRLAPGRPSGITGGGVGPEDPALTGPAGKPSGRHDAEPGGAPLCRAAVFRSRNDRDLAD